MRTLEGASEIRIDKLAQQLPSSSFTPIEISGVKAKTVWVASVEVKISALSESRNIAIIMNDSTFDKASDVDYLITNVDSAKVKVEWLLSTYSQKNWVEVFYREAKGWLGLKEYQVRSQRSLERLFILVFCAYIFILWNKLTGGFRRRWANRELNTFVESLEAFRTAMSFRGGVPDTGSGTPATVVFSVGLQIGTCFWLIKLVWASFGFDFCLSPANLMFAKSFYTYALHSLIKDVHYLMNEKLIIIRAFLGR